MRETNIDPQNIEEMYIKYYATLKRYSYGWFHIIPVTLQ